MICTHQKKWCFWGGRYLIGYAEVGVSAEIFFKKNHPKVLTNAISGITFVQKLNEK